MNRLRVRRDISSDDMLAIEDVRERALDRAMVDDGEGCCMLASAVTRTVVRKREVVHSTRRI